MCAITIYFNSIHEKLIQATNEKDVNVNMACEAHANIVYVC